MSCNSKNSNCNCRFNIKTFGTCDVAKIKLPGNDRTALNWSEISIPEIVQIPLEKPEIEHLDQVYVEAIVDGVKLIETPFAYKSYERQATDFEISTATEAVNLAKIDITPITNAVNAILAIPGLPAIPAVAALTAALNGVTAAANNLTTTVTNVLAQLNTPCIAASVVVTLLNTVTAALNILKQALNALILAANALVTATAAIPIVGGLVSTAVKLLLTTINTTINLVLNALTAITAAILLVGNTNILVIEPNEEGTCLSGRKLIIEGELKQKIVYTGLVPSQSVHSVCNAIPFNAYIIPYANFVGLTYVENVEVIVDPADPCTTQTVNGFFFDPAQPLQVDLYEEFTVSTCVEDIFAYDINSRDVFKNITLFLSAKPSKTC